MKTIQLKKTMVIAWINDMNGDLLRAKTENPMVVGNNSKWCLVLMGYRGMPPRPSFYFAGRILSEVTRGGFEWLTGGTVRSENERERRGKGGSIINGKKRTDSKMRNYQKLGGQNMKLTKTLRFVCACYKWKRRPGIQWPPIGTPFGKRVDTSFPPR